MALLSRGLAEVLARAGVCQIGPMDEKFQTLEAWLVAQGVLMDHPVVLTYFGVPYRPLKQDAQLTVATMPDHEEWRLYYYVQAQCYVCVRPPQDAEKTAFVAHYGAQPLYITDETSVHAVLLGGCLPQKQGGYHLQHVYDVREMLRQGMNHIDGLIGGMLLDAIRSEATDIHCYSLDGRFHIDFRVHGVLQPYVVLSSCSTEPLLNKLKLMADMDIAEHRLPQDGHIVVVLDGATCHLRLGTLPLLDGEKMVIRILPAQSRYATLAGLGFTLSQKKTLEALLQRNQGLLLITGPTNSGKTTTLYACLRLLAQAGKLVYTIEDPVEALVDGVQQSQVNGLGGYSFAQGLRGMLRSDPDVLAVGELRDGETVDIAARAALSGHLVVATLHAANAHQTVNRLRDLGLSDLLLSAVLLAVVNQRLVPLVCEACGGDGVDAKGACCSCCLGTGTVGRTGIQELWVPSEEERAGIERGINSVTLRQEAIERGFPTLSVVAQEKGMTLSSGEERV